jgi:Predicted O-methyltransferase
MIYDADTHEKPQSHYEQAAETTKATPSQVRKQALAYMDLLDGWCSKEKGSILVDLVLKTKPEIIVEIGVWGGKSLVPMAYALKVNGRGRIVGIDPWSNQASVEEVANPDNKAFWAHVNHTAVMNGLIEKMREFNLENEIELIRATSEEATPIEEIDILHVDGNHSDKTSYFDVVKWGPLVKKGGWIIFDDMTWYENGKYTTARAVEWLNMHCIKLAQFSDNCDWGIWVKP